MAGGAGVEVGTIVRSVADVGGMGFAIAAPLPTIAVARIPACWVLLDGVPVRAGLAVGSGAIVAAGFGVDSTCAGGA